MATFEVEVFAPGHWAKRDWTIAQLDEMVRNFSVLHPLGIKPPVKLGHTERQILAQPDGQPALGWVTGLRRNLTKLVATVSHVPALITDLVKARRYSRLSAELYPAFQDSDMEKNLRSGCSGCVLAGVSFLGADVPEVKTLEDLHRVLATEDEAFLAAEIVSLVTGAGDRENVSADVAIGFAEPLTVASEPPTQGDSMTDQEKAEVAAQKAELAKLTERLEAAERIAADSAKHAADISRLTEENARLAKAHDDALAREAVAAGRARRAQAVQFVETRSRPDVAKLFPAQRALAEALYEKLAGMDGEIIDAAEGKAKFGEERGYSAVELFEALIDATPARKFQLAAVTHNDPTPDAFAGPADVPAAIEFICKRDKLDRRKPDDLRQAADRVRSEFPNLGHDYRGYAAGDNA